MRGSAQKSTVSTYVVRWTDKGTLQSKEYSDYATAQKAVRWLADNGIDDADIAVSPPKRPKGDDSAKDEY